MQFQIFGLRNKHNKFLGCFKAFSTLSNNFSNLLSFTVLNIETAVTKILFESKLRGDPIGITMSSFLGKVPFQFSFKKHLFYNW